MWFERIFKSELRQYTNWAQLSREAFAEAEATFIAKDRGSFYPTCLLRHTITCRGSTTRGLLLRLPGWGWHTGARLPIARSIRIYCSAALAECTGVKAMSQMPPETAAFL